MFFIPFPLQNTAPSHKPSRSDKNRESLDLSHSNEVYNIDTHHQKVLALIMILLFELDM